MRRRTFALLDIVVIVAALGLFALIPGSALDEGAPDRLIVTVGDGSSPEVRPLVPDREFAIEGRLGETVLRIEDGALRVLSSPCPNKICVRMGAIKLNGQVVVCVPNRVSVRLSGGGGEGLDAIVR